MAKQIGDPGSGRAPGLSEREDPPCGRIDGRSDTTVRATEPNQLFVQRLGDTTGCRFCEDHELDVRCRLQAGLVSDEVVVGACRRPSCGAEAEQGP